MSEGSGAEARDSIVSRVSALPTPRRWLFAAAWLGILGAVAGPIYDGIHTWSGATWYANPGFMRSVWWCPPLFAAAAIALGLANPAYDVIILRRNPRGATAGVIASTMAVFTLAYVTSGFLPGEWWLKTAILTGLFVMNIHGAGGEVRNTLPNAAIAAIAGWAVEYLLTQRGLFTHRDTELMGVAGWIPPLYATASVAVGAIGRRLVGGVRIG